MTDTTEYVTLGLGAYVIHAANDSPNRPPTVRPGYYLIISLITGEGEGPPDTVRAPCIDARGPFESEEAALAFFRQEMLPHAPLVLSQIADAAGLGPTTGNPKIQTRAPDGTLTTAPYSASDLAKNRTLN